MDMDLIDLRLAVAVAETGSFTAAAERLRYTQSAVSRRIAALERAAGAPLFRRAARGVTLSPAGAALVEHARTALRAVDDAEAAVAAARDGLAGPLRVGAIPTANAALVPRALARMEARRPDIALRFREGGSPDLAAAVGAGELDLAVVFGAVADAPAGTRTVELLRDPLLVALPRGHRLAMAATVDVAELAGERWVQGAPDVADVVLELADPAPRRVFRVREWTAKQGFVAAGLGITIIAALAADGVRSDVELRPLRGAGSARRVVAVVDAAAGPAVELLLDLLREETGKLWKDRRP